MAAGIEAAGAAIVGFRRARQADRREQRGVARYCGAVRTVGIGLYL